MNRARLLSAANLYDTQGRLYQVKGNKLGNDFLVGNPLKFTDPSGSYVEVAGEANQRIFWDAVSGSMAPGAATHLKWKDNRLVIVGMSAWAFSKMYGLVGHQLAYLTSSPQAFKVEFGSSRKAN